MALRRSPAAAALAGWSLLVWTTRLRNLWSDDGLSAGARWSRTALALSFTVLGLAVLYAVVRDSRWRRPAVLVLAGWTAAVWVVRAIGIVAADHDAAFIAVHVVLAVVSIALAALAVAEVGRVSSESDPSA
jgi:hypothetical protein